MQLESISLYQFKNYPEKRLDFKSKISCIVGANGVGKTNILDAIYMLCLARSYFNNVEKNNILHGANAYGINGKIYKSNNCNSNGCACDCAREGPCCNIFKETDIPQASEHLAHHIKHRAITASTCGQHKHKSQKPKHSCSCKE